MLHERLHPEGLQLRGTGPDLSVIAIFQPCRAPSALGPRVSHLSKDDDVLLSPLGPWKMPEKEQ